MFTWMILSFALLLVSFFWCVLTGEIDYLDCYSLPACLLLLSGLSLASSITIWAIQAIN